MISELICLCPIIVVVVVLMPKASAFETTLFMRLHMLLLWHIRRQRADVERAELMQLLSCRGKVADAFLYVHPTSNNP